ncbi:alanine and glycine-rich protein-like [Mytilus trossulus]|uniref:alanine and glycine-rich protein-like n=1 Tax=Mytilus trossulus TaxID=6551 RepID=UPI0030060B01
MVGLTVAVVSAIAVTGGGAALVAGAGAGAGCGALGAGAAEVATIGSAIGSGMSAGAIAGASVSTGGTVAATYTGAGIGAVAGGISGGAVSGSGLGIGLLAGSTGFGAILVGASDDVDSHIVTYDCWKPVIKEKSMVQSKGILMKDLLNHPNVSEVTATTGHHSDLPNIVIKNIWDELFTIEYLWLHTADNIVCHAKPVS